MPHINHSHLPPDDQVPGGDIRGTPSSGVCQWIDEFWKEQLVHPENASFRYIENAWISYYCYRKDLDPGVSENRETALEALEELRTNNHSQYAFEMSLVVEEVVRNHTEQAGLYGEGCTAKNEELLFVLGNNAFHSTLRINALETLLKRQDVDPKDFCDVLLSNAKDSNMDFTLAARSLGVMRLCSLTQLQTSRDIAYEMLDNDQRICRKAALKHLVTYGLNSNHDNLAFRVILKDYYRLCFAPIFFDQFCHLKASSDLFDRILKEQPELIGESALNWLSHFGSEDQKERVLNFALRSEVIPPLLNQRDLRDVYTNPRYSLERSDFLDVTPRRAMAEYKESVKVLKSCQWNIITALRWHISNAAYLNPSNWTDAVSAVSNYSRAELTDQGHLFLDSLAARCESSLTFSNFAKRVHLLIAKLVS